MTTITINRATVEQALEALGHVVRQAQENLVPTIHYGPVHDVMNNLRAALAQQAEPDTYGYASRLAVAIWEKHYKDAAPQWKPLDDMMGVLTQIDNMTSGLTRLAQQAEPVDTDCHTQGICQRSGYGIGQQAEAVPFGCVTVRRLSLRHENHADQYQFYPAGQSPYLDNADECHTVYTAPPQRKPLTDEEIEACRQQGYDHDGLHSPFDFREAARAVERAHGIKE